jgi:uncharacterized protein (DUF433 family)
MSVEATSRYVTRNPDILQGEPIITGTRTSVRAIVESWRLGIRPEEIPMHLPHLTLAQVFDALSFYLDNQPEINEYIERNRVPEELIHPKVRQRDRRAFLKLPVAQRNALLSQQAAIVAEDFQPGAEGMEWTDEYIEDESMDDE